VCLAVAGNTQQQAQFEALALRLGVAERLRFLGSLSDVSVAYQAAQLLVHPTLEDSYAMAVVEAMANDLPVIVSGPAFCGVAAELSHQVNAWLLDDPLDAAELAQAINSLLSNKELQRQVLIGSQAFFALKTWQNTALLHERLYQHIAAYKVAYKAGDVALGDSAASPNKALDTPPEAK
jgi:glycosyltransferase involved in cell wall biosynthesis